MSEYNYFLRKNRISTVALKIENCMYNYVLSKKNNKKMMENKKVEKEKKKRKKERATLNIKFKNILSKDVCAFFSSVLLKWKKNMFFVFTFVYSS